MRLMIRKMIRPIEADGLAYSRTARALMGSARSTSVTSSRGTIASDLFPLQMKNEQNDPSNDSSNEVGIPPKTHALATV